MKLEDIEIVGVVGSGSMGNGIAQVVAAAGFSVILCDISLEAADQGFAAIQTRLQKDVEKEKLTALKAADILERIETTGDYSDLANVDILFEAIFENIELKKDFYRTVEDICKPQCIYATNTSGLSVTEMAAATRRADKVIGTHFFFPAPVMKLVELIRGYDTSEETYALIVAFLERLGKELITVHEAPLFCVNRILVPMINEAIFVLQEGIATRDDIDKGMRLGANHPVGPLALADMLGLDTLLAVLEHLYEETKDSKYRPCTLLAKMVRAGHYGRKSGEGFYQY